MSQDKCCPDLGFVIVSPSYHSGKVPGTGHAGAAVVNGRTGELRYNDFTREDQKN